MSEGYPENWKHAVVHFNPETKSIHFVTFIPAKGKFHALWDSINAKRGYPWENNDWVWVYEFMRIE